MSDYTPTTDDVETWYVGNHDPAHAHEFRRWLKAHDAEVAAQALRDYAQARYLDHLDDPDLPWIEQPSPMARDYARTTAALRDRANQIERGEG